MKVIAFVMDVISLMFVGSAVYGFLHGGPSVFECSVMAVLLQLRSDQIRRRSEK